MKLLGWMHRKLRQNNTTEPFKDIGIVNPCNCLSGQQSLQEQQEQNYQKYNYGPRTSKSQMHNLLHRSSFTGRGDGEDYYDDQDYNSSYAESGYFNGLLAIGTLGTEMEPETPTFPDTLENVATKETITENDLRLINDELEKILGADMKEDKWADSARTSQVSTITLSGTDGIGSAPGICPLQDYLFGSSVGLPEPTTAVKKEHRMSLGELFQKTKVEEELGEKEEKKGEKDGEKSVRKRLKKKILGSSIADSVSVDTKLNKIRQMFHRKVHPEGAASMKKSSKHNKNDIRNNVMHDGGGNCTGDGSLLSVEAASTVHKISVSKERIRCLKKHSRPPSFAIDRSDSNGNREYWIKTDADYLVLEL